MLNRKKNQNTHQPRKATKDEKLMQEYIELCNRVNKNDEAMRVELQKAHHAQLEAQKDAFSNLTHQRKQVMQRAKQPAQAKAAATQNASLGSLAGMNAQLLYGPGTFTASSPSWYASAASQAPPMEAGDVWSCHEKLKEAIKKLESCEAAKIEEEVPDRIEPIVCWRAWSVSRQGILGIGYDHPWKAGEANKAYCYVVRSFSDSHEAPYEGCGCGFWGFKSRELLLPQLFNYSFKNLVIGEVYLWGRYIECKKGFRAEFAYPKELWLPDRAMREMVRPYNVPVRCL